MKTEYLYSREIERVLGCLMPQNRLVVRCIEQTGLRLSDVLALQTADLMKGRQWWITEQKTGKRRRVNLDDQLRRELIDIAGEKWIFQHRTDPTKHRSRTTVWRDVKRAARAYRIPQNVSPHSFRKVYAVKLRQKYHDVQRVQRALNHSSLAVTLIYAAADTLLEDRLKRRRR